MLPCDAARAAGGIEFSLPPTLASPQTAWAVTTSQKTEMDADQASTCAHGGDCVVSRFFHNGEAILNTAAFLTASEIWWMACVCKTTACTSHLGRKRTIGCEGAAARAICDSHSCDHKDEAVEYLASSEFRYCRVFGHINFSYFCFTECRSYRKFGQTPSLDEILEEWEQLRVSDNQLSLQKAWRSRKQDGICRESCYRLSVPEIVAARYEADGNLVGRSTCLPQRRRAFREHTRDAMWLVAQGFHSDAAAAFDNILEQKPDHALSNYMLGELLVGDSDIPGDELRAAELLSIAARQGHFESAIKLGHIHIALGKLAHAQAAFELALVADWTSPLQRKHVESIMSVLRGAVARRDAQNT